MKDQWHLIDPPSSIEHRDAVDRATVLAMCEQLGHDPKTVAGVLMTPDRIDVLVVGPVERNAHRAATLHRHTVL